MREGRDREEEGEDTILREERGWKGEERREGEYRRMEEIGGGRVEEDGRERKEEGYNPEAGEEVTEGPQISGG